MIPPTNHPLVWVVTLNWNRPIETADFLASCAALEYPCRRTLLVDNASTDGSPDALTTRFPDVDLLVNPANLGFAAGMNTGIRRAVAEGADFVFVANNDTRLAPDLLDYLVAAATTCDSDLAAPAIYRADDPAALWHAGGRFRHWTLETTALDRTINDEDVPYAVDYVTCCGLLLSRRCIESVGLFDEGYYLYYEDLDYCRRARSRGCRIIVAPRARMWHTVATTVGGIDSPAERFHMAKSSVRYFRTHARGPRRLVVVPYRAASTARTVARLVCSGRRAAARSYVRGLWEGLRAE